jgi:hypothetical protein
MMHLPRQFQEPESGIPGGGNGEPACWPTAYRAYAQAATGFRRSGHAIDRVAAMRSPDLSSA